jgi:hypothetical protein
VFDYTVVYRADASTCAERSSQGRLLPLSRANGAMTRGIPSVIARYLADPGNGSEGGRHRGFDAYVPSRYGGGLLDPSFLEPACRQRGQRHQRHTRDYYRPGRRTVQVSEAPNAGEDLDPAPIPRARMRSLGDEGGDTLVGL